jgi:hypothetical protein
VEVFADASSLDKTLAGATRKLDAWGSQLTRIGQAGMTAGLAAGSAFVAATVRFASAGDELNKLAAKTGVSVEALSELKFAAKQSGAELSDVSAVLLKMNRRFGRLSAGQGSASQTEAIEELGLSVKTLSSMNAEERFLALADAMSNYGDNAAAAGLAQRIFGTSIDKLLPLIFSGAEGIEKLRQESRDLGLQMSTQDAAAAAALTDAWGRVSSTLDRVVVVLGSALAPALESLADVVLTGTVSMIKWVDVNRDMVVHAFEVTVAVTGLAAAILILGNGLLLASSAMKGFMAASAGLKAIALLAGGPWGLLLKAVVAVGVAAAVAFGVMKTSGKSFGIDFGGVWDALTKKLSKFHGVLDTIKTLLAKVGIDVGGPNTVATADAPEVFEKFEHAGGMKQKKPVDALGPKPVDALGPKASDLLTGIARLEMLGSEELSDNPSFMQSSPDRMQGMQNRITAAGNASVVGTFSGRSAGQMSGIGPERTMEKKMDDQTELLGDINKKMDQFGLEVA